ncbi:MAG TPA: YdeI/OmpD-associated family protein [Lapillicoccus sp.]|jgi:uncharacterized protein YdeI (YjbR/CyaY-like superfamily)|nr:YdeI/OmpD-associated family protein [Lapillicoccus sp.]
MSALRRPQQPMPDDVAEALRAAGVHDAYRERPAYQRNDYLAWIARAEKDETRRKRLRQMVRELREGGVYMGMAHGPSRRDRIS